MPGGEMPQLKLRPTYLLFRYAGPNFSSGDQYVGPNFSSGDAVRRPEL
jgi:hypothetical protein